MKNLLFILLALLGFAACSNEDSTTPKPSSEEQEELTLIERVRSQMEDILEENCNFDFENAPSLFAGKKWVAIYDVECDAEWNITRAFWCTDESFVCEPGYSVSTVELNAEDDPERSWEYDPSTQTLTMQKFEYHILALSEELLMWEFSYLDANGKMRYNREVYKFAGNIKAEE